MYLLFILEGAFILPKRSQVWMLVAASALLYGAVLFGEYVGVLPHVEMPFVRNELHHNYTFVLVRYLWFVTLYTGVAIVGLLMMRSIREREAELKETSFIDDLTGLFNRQYFQRVLTTEVERARRNGRGVALVLADLYRLSEINRTFGVDVGDALVAAFADQARHAAAADAAEVGFEVCVGARVGGEEIALIVPDISPGTDDEIPLEQRALAIAERLRTGMEGVLAHGVGAVASVGVAVFPRDAHTADELFDAADAMLASASEAGGNCVRVTWIDGECLRGEE
jgi:diguanylate cyclase (GGDEF)-like protein